MDNCAPFNRCTRVQWPLDDCEPRSQRQKHPRISRTSLAVAFLAATLPATAAQSCISLQGSTECPAFSNASISTNLRDFGFLSFVTDVESFDDRLRDYIGTSYVQDKYINILGCSNVSLTNTTNLYARYTTTFLCNSIVQASLSSCNQNSGQEVVTLCADSCAQFAISEQDIISTPAFCGTPGNNANDQIRSDSDRCQHAAKALTGTCTPAVNNEPDECGFASNLPGLCAFCRNNTLNGTDSCCVNADVEARCVDVQLPTTTTMPPLFTTTTTAAPTGTGSAGGGGSSSGLSGGAIAGIVVGSLLGAALLLGLVIVGCIFARKRKQKQQHSVLNTPSPVRQISVAPPMTYGGDGHSPPPTIIPGARVARMSALEGSASSEGHSSRAGGYHDRLDPYDSPESHRAYLGAANLPKREGSLSSHSALGAVSSSPHSGSDPDRNFSSPEGVASGQSEQLQFFKDYYSQDDIHPNDTVAVLWAYQPRANDEFELERGDMLKVVGIWDDGWATGVRLAETTEEWEARRALQRDSGVSNGSRRESRIESDSDIKAFPLVCVCLPQHWRKTIEGDSTDTGGGSGGDRHPPSP